MRDLHVYVEPVGSAARGEWKAFYSRRADGPYYRWLYAEGQGSWCYSRVSLDRPTLRMLCVAPWDAVPATLRSRLGEHYLE
ncbi:MAG: hypothetical protein ABW250_24850 [Pyrinomonadaceae bacterium]